MAGLQLEGGARLRRTLKQAGADLSTLKAANKSAASVVSAAGAARAPVVTGALARSVRAAGTNTAGVVRAGNNRRTAAGVPYAGPIHWGHPARGISPNTFLSDAAKATEPVWLPAYYAALDDALSQIKGK